MLFGKLDLPDEVWRAALEDRLVVFTGAGASNDSPANLPDFKGLARAISKDLLPELQLKDDEDAVDEFLGRLDDAGVKVHQRAADFLGAVAPKPTDLHKSLVGMFSGPSALRIVTTNFDELFEDAVVERWQGVQIEQFAAPALPVGSKFQGVVHLHGRLGRPADQLTLTDADFSRAYLTEGWARRFVRELAQEYVVLFVGFSFGDVPSKYLLRGLPVGRVRSLVAVMPTNEATQAPSGVTRILFDPSGGYLDLKAGLQEFAQFTSRDAAQHREALEILAKGGPPGPGPETDYLVWALRDSVQASYLLESADFASPIWLDWLNERGLLDLLFDRWNPSPPEGHVRALELWFSRLALEDETWKRCVELLAARSGQLSSSCRQSLESEVWRRVAQAKAAGIPHLTTKEEYWLAVLTGSPAAAAERSALAYVLDDLTDAGVGAVLEIWRELADPRLSLSPSTRYPGDTRDLPSARTELVLGIDDYALRKAWERLRQRLADVAPQLIPILLDQIENGNRLLRMTAVASDQFDPESFKRSVIADHPQNRSSGHEPFSILIDAARDCLEVLDDVRPELARAWETIFLVSGAPLARRIGIHSYSRRAGLAADAALERLTTEEWLEIPGAKPEAFAVLRAAYPRASDSAKELFLRTRTPAPPFEESRAESEDEDLDAKISQYEWFNLLTWLSDSDPDDERVRRELGTLRVLQPEFERREFPELDHWMGEGGFVSAESPFADERVKAMSTADLIREYGELPGWDRRDFLVDQRRGLLEQVGRLAAGDLGWGKLKAEELHEHGPNGKDLVAAIFRGWSQHELEPQSVRELLAWAFGQKWLQEFSGEIAHLLQEALKKSAESLEDAELERSLSLISSFWCNLPDLDAEERPKDWLSVAINRPQGDLALSVLHLASGWRKRHGGDGAPLPAKLLELVSTMVSGKSAAQALARVVLASQLHFFFALDERLAVEEILPWFSWGRHPGEAVQAWDGYLSWGRIHPRLFQHLLRSIRETFSNLEELGGRRKRFSEFVAHCSLLPQNTPVESGWLDEYFQKATAEDRNHWATWLAGQMRNLDPTIIREIWGRWLRHWVHVRLTTGFPKITGAELVAYYGLALALPADLVTEMVAMLREAPAPPRQFDLVFWRLEERASELEPDDVLHLMILLFENPPPYTVFRAQFKGELAAKIQASGDEAGKRRLKALLVAAHSADLVEALLGGDSSESNQR